MSDGKVVTVMAVVLEVVMVVVVVSDHTTRSKKI